MFGGEIQIPSYDDYDQYLMPGIFAQIVVFGPRFTSLGLAEDLSKGLIDRLRSLPISQAAILILCPKHRDVRFDFDQHRHVNNGSYWPVFEEMMASLRF